MGTEAYTEIVKDGKWEVIELLPKEPIIYSNLLSSAPFGGFSPALDAIRFSHSDATCK